MNNDDLTNTTLIINPTSQPVAPSATSSSLDDFDPIDPIAPSLDNIPVKMSPSEAIIAKDYIRLLKSTDQPTSSN